MKIAIVLGTRPEAIKLVPVYSALINIKEVDTVLISTGQHAEMVGQIFNFFKIEPDFNLKLMQPNQSLSALSASIISSLDLLFNEIKPDIVIVQGDTTTCFITSLVAYHHKIQIIHVEAGLRTHNNYSPFPEEGYRQMVSNIASIHFAPTMEAKNNLLKENINEENIYVVGNTVIDSILMAKKIIISSLAWYENDYADILSSDSMILITSHRRENFGEGLNSLCEALLDLARQYPKCNFIYPVHLNPNVKKPVYDLLNGVDNIKLIDPLPYDKLIFLMMKSRLVMTDSGGIQEEAPTLGKPVLVMRYNTERPEGIEAGCSVLVGTDKMKIIETFKIIMDNEQIYERMSQVQNPYGDGTTSIKIRDTIMSRLIKV